MRTFVEFLNQEHQDLRESLGVPPEHKAEFDAIVAKARAEHQRKAKAAKKAGKSFPDTPYEGSWAHEQEFIRSKKKR